MDLSVIIVNYNGEELLRECLHSIYKRNWNINLETIVVDNGSTDGTIKMLNSEFSEIKLISAKGNDSFARSNNLGLKLACGRYALFLNNDTVVQENAFDRAVQFMDNHLEVGAVGFKLLNPDGSLQPSGRPFPSISAYLSGLIGISDRFYVPSRNYEEIEEVDEASGACIMVRSACLKEIGGWDEHFSWGYEDLDLCYRIEEKGHKIFYFPDAQVVHYWGRTRNKREIQVDEMESALYYFKKYFSRFQFNFLRVCLFLFTCLTLIKIGYVFHNKFKAKLQTKLRLLRTIVTYL